MKRIVCVFLLAVLLILPAAAHSGGTDSSGGHYDSSTGEYHYHHGYPAHSHPGGQCPYKSEKPHYTPSSPSSSSSGSSSHSHSSGSSKGDGENLLGKISAIFLGFIIFVVIVSSFGNTKKPPKVEPKEPPKIEPKEPPKIEPKEPPKIEPKEPPKVKPKDLPKYEPQERPTHTPLQTTVRSSAPIVNPPVSPPISQPSPSSPKPSPFIKSQKSPAQFNFEYFNSRIAAWYVESINTDRSKRALTEDFQITGIIKDTSKKPIAVKGTIESSSDHRYFTSLTECTCLDHRKRKVVCKHMIALAIKADAIRLSLKDLEKHSQK